MILRKNLTSVGKFNKSHGINGEISAVLDSELYDLTSVKHLISSVDGIFVPFFIENIRTKGNRSLIVKLENVNSELDTKLLVNKDIYVDSDELQELSVNQDEYALDYFIGYTIVDLTLGEVGEIVDVDDSTENYLFIVETKSDTIVYIPATDDFIIDINFEYEQLQMDLPEGLLSI